MLTTPWGLFPCLKSQDRNLRPRSYLLPKVSALKTIKPTKTWAVVALAVCLIAFVALGVSTIVKHNNKLQFQKVELQDTSAKLKLLQQQYDVQLKSKNVDESKLRDLEKQKEDLEKQLSVKQEAKRVADAQALEAQQAAERLASAVTQTQRAYAAPVTVAGCGDNSYANFIYMHESGCSTFNANKSNGACGLGQAYPCSKLSSVCPGMDYGCENAWFTNYAVQRYGSWAAAYSYWLAHSNW